MGSGMEMNKSERPQSVYVGSHFISLMSPPPRSTQQLIGGVYELSLLYRKDAIIKWLTCLPLPLSHQYSGCMLYCIHCMMFPSMEMELLGKPSKQNA